MHTSRLWNANLSPPKLSRRTWGTAIGVCVVVALALSGWHAVHRFHWAGPLAADALRAVLGPAPVAWLENVLYGWQDRFDEWRFAGQPPKTYWNVEPSAPEVVSRERAGRLAADEQKDRGVFPPPSASLLHAPVAAPGDGVWISAGLEPVDRSAVLKTMLHPDPERSYAVLAVVALDLQRISVHSVPGTIEPKGAPVPPEMRQGTIPLEQQEQLIAAFNGGYQSVHGHYGMMVDGWELLPPVDDACTIALYVDGTVAIRTWPELADARDRMAAFRQTPPCLVERGERHPDLMNRYSTMWGAAVGGKTVIRRSALGLSQDQRTLFFGMGDSLTARSLADGMRAAGAFEVAQLDVNQSFPRFVFFGRSADGVCAVSGLCDGFSFSSDEYVREPKVRDFFYVTRKNEAR